MDYFLIASGETLEKNTGSAPEVGIVASPRDQDALDTTRERERMRQALESLERRGLVRLT